MSRRFLLFMLYPLVLTACESEIPSWFLGAPCLDGEYKLSNLETETQTCTVLPDSCSLDQFASDDLTDECRTDLCPEDLPASVIVASEDGQISADCGAPVDSTLGPYPPL